MFQLLEHSNNNFLLYPLFIAKVEFLLADTTVSRNVENVAIVEMESISVTKDDKPFNNIYCWVVHFTGEEITKVHAYVDSVLVKQIIEENE